MAEEKPEATKRFDPRKYLIQLKGKYYLETKYRIQWFRNDHPQGRILTEVLNYEPILVKATVLDSAGTVLATAHAGAKDSPGAVWSGRSVEKAETAAIGRALGHAGWGTQFTSEGEQHDEAESGHLADSPVERRGASGPRRSAPGLAGGDLRDKEVASRFIQRWRAQSLSDNDVLAALGVEKLSAWEKGRTAADDAVNAWLAAKTQKTA